LQQLRTTAAQAGTAAACQPLQRASPGIYSLLDESSAICAGEQSLALVHTADQGMQTQKRIGDIPLQYILSQLCFTVHARHAQIALHSFKHKNDVITL
jgi:hypothetical protein